VIRPVKQGACLSWDDVRVDDTTKAYALRREMEAR
jgi:predicted homoserine dehydrogenase-like protein